MGETPQRSEPSSTDVREALRYPSFRGEQHWLVRVLGGTALRLNDAYGAGILAPAYGIVDGTWQFVNVGGFRMGPSLGAQMGLDVGHGPVQFAVQPGWLATWRISSPFALTGRVNVPFL